MTYGYHLHLISLAAHLDFSIKCLFCLWFMYVDWNKSKHLFYYRQLDTFPAVISIQVRFRPFDIHLICGNAFFYVYFCMLYCMLILFYFYSCDNRNSCWRQNQSFPCHILHHFSISRGSRWSRFVEGLFSFWQWFCKSSKNFHYSWISFSHKKNHGMKLYIVYFTLYSPYCSSSFFASVKSTL